MRDAKSKNMQLERKRIIFLEVGLIIVLAAVLMAFNYRTYHSSTYLDFNQTPNDFPEDLALITVQPPAPLPTPPVPAPFFNIRENDVDIEDDYTIDVEANQNTKVDDYVPYIPDEVRDAEPEPMVFPQIFPSFPGGESARLQFLRNTLKYPRTAKEIGISGTVYIQFVVEPDGKITNIEVLRGPDNILNEEAIRVTSMMPKWEPGMQGGKAVRVQYTMAIKFILN